MADTEPSTAFDVVKTIATIWAFILSVITSIYGLWSLNRNRRVLKIELMGFVPQYIPLVAKRFSGKDIETERKVWGVSLGFFVLLFLVFLMAFLTCHLPAPQ